jgi:hypothetical protein
MSEEDSLTKKGRPKGSKNKPKRGRPKKLIKKRPRGRPSNPVIEEKFNNKALSVKSEEALIDSFLDDSKMHETGFNYDTDKIINENPIDDSFYYRGAKNVPIAGARYEFTAEMVLNLKRCKEDIVYFAENFFQVVTLDKGKCLIKLHPVQENILRSLVDNRFVALLAARQTGKSTLLTIFVLWMALFHNDHRAAIVANKETTAINIFKRIRMAYEQLPNYIKAGVKEYGKTGMTLDNDSSIIVSTTTATSIRGDTLNCLAGESEITYRDKTGILYNISIEQLNSMYEVCP